VIGKVESLTEMETSKGREIHVGRDGKKLAHPEKLYYLLCASRRRRIIGTPLSPARISARCSVLTIGFSVFRSARFLAAV
jgi:hypothetical protein